MKYCHFSGDKKHDLHWFWSTCVLTALCVLFFGGVCIGITVGIVITKENPVYLLVAVGVFVMGCTVVLRGAWRIERFFVSGNGIHLQNVLYKRFYNWHEIKKVEVLTVNVIKHGLPADYIILYLTDDPFWTNVPHLDNYFSHRDETIAIRYSPERLEEIEHFMARGKESN